MIYTNIWLKDTHFPKNHFQQSRQHLAVTAIKVSTRAKLSHSWNQPNAAAYAFAIQPWGFKELLLLGWLPRLCAQWDTHPF